MRSIPALISPAVSISTAVLLIAVAIVPFLTPAWVGFEQGRADAAAWTGFTPDELRRATDGILADLIVGPPDFDVQVAGTAVLNADERAHMRDVRGVFSALYGAAAVAVGVLVLAWAAANRAAGWTRDRAVRAVRAGATGLAIVIAALGLVALVAFDLAFEAFHRLFFAVGSYTFDPSTDRLVQLFPEAFWSETAIVAGVVILGASVTVAALAHRRTIAHAGAPAAALTPVHR